MSGERGPLALSGCRRGCPRAEGLPPHTLASFLVPPKMNVLTRLALSMSGWTLVPVLLWVWVQPTSLAMAETSWQHELLQGADASGSACFLQCHH